MIPYDLISSCVASAGGHLYHDKMRPGLVDWGPATHRPMPYISAIALLFSSGLNTSRAKQDEVEQAELTYISMQVHPTTKQHKYISDAVYQQLQGAFFS